MPRKFLWGFTLSHRCLQKQFQLIVFSQSWDNWCQSFYRQTESQIFWHSILVGAFWLVKNPVYKKEPNNTKRRPMEATFLLSPLFHRSFSNSTTFLSLQRVRPTSGRVTLFIILSFYIFITDVAPSIKWTFFQPTPTPTNI